MTPSNSGNVHSVETFGTFDGPGLRYVLFLQGCAYECLYCHNRDTWDMKMNKAMSVSDVLNDYKKYQAFYKNGGLTVSGGEALLQAEFVCELFEAAKQLGIHTCLDTSGSVTLAPQVLDRLLSVTDLVLLDIKHIKSDKHKILTNRNNDSVLAFARQLSDRNIKTIIRHVLVPGYTDDKADLRAMREFIQTLKNIEAVEILPYHAKGSYKWEALGYTYPLKHVVEPSQEAIKLAKSILLG